MSADLQGDLSVTLSILGIIVLSGISLLGLFMLCCFPNTEMFIWCYRFFAAPPPPVATAQFMDPTHGVFNSRNLSLLGQVAPSLLGPASQMMPGSGSIRNYMPEVRTPPPPLFLFYIRVLLIFFKN